MATTTKAKPYDSRIYLVGILGWLIPGAGHLLLGQKGRAAILLTSIGMLWLGGFFIAPYGPWADMVYSRAAAYTATLKVVKRAFDPDNILNPGKLCF